jgi:hypothetical protein
MDEMEYAEDGHNLLHRRHASWPLIVKGEGEYAEGEDVNEK